MKQQYDSYKSSGIDWIGEIPSHWDLKRLRLVCEFRNGYTPSKDNKLFWIDGTIPWYRMEDIRESGRFLNEAKQYITEEAVKGGGLFEAGSFILATTATIGEHAMLIVDSLANQRFTNLKIRKSLARSAVKEFFFYYLYVIDEFCKSSTKTATFPAMNMEDLRNFKVCLPPVNEQEAIATWLDEKCGEIDAAIAKVDREIELIDELKQSEISRVVTLGLNHNAPLRPSGIDWISEIPESWTTMKLKHTVNNVETDFMDGDWIESNDISTDGIRYLTSGNVGPAFYKEQGEGFITEETFTKLNCIEVFPGDLLISRLNEPIARTCFVPDLGYRIVTCVDNVIYRPQTDKFDKRYMMYQLNCKPFWFNASQLSSGATMQRISRSKLGSISVLVPPLVEQREIADYLDKRCAEIDGLKSKLKSKRDTLVELRHSMISEVVTGKRKVV